MTGNAAASDATDSLGSEVPWGRLLLAGLTGLGIGYFVYAGWLMLPPAESWLVARKGVAGGADFIIFYTASVLVQAGRAVQAYDLAAFTQTLNALTPLNKLFPWSYPPPIFLLVAPLASLPYGVALSLWLILPLAGLVAILRRFGAPLLFLVVMPMLAQAVVAGQNGCLTALLVCGGLVLLPRRPVLAGAVLGMLVYKPHLAALLPVCLLAVGAWRALVAMAISGAAVTLVSGLALGWEVWFAFQHQLSLQLQYLSGQRFPMLRIPTVFVMLLQGGMPAETAWLLQGAATLGVAALVWLVWRRTLAIPEDRALLVRSLALAAALPLATPYAFDYDLALFGLPAALLAGRLTITRPSPATLALLLSCWAVTWLVRGVSFLLGQQVGPLLLFPILLRALWLARCFKVQESSTGGVGSVTML